MSDPFSQGPSGFDSTSSLLADWDIEGEPGLPIPEMTDPDELAAELPDPDRVTFRRGSGPAGSGSDASLAFLAGFSLREDAEGLSSGLSSFQSGEVGETVLHRARQAGPVGGRASGSLKPQPRSDLASARPWLKHDLPRVGDVLAGFRILRELGRGAFARVYLAEEIHLGRRPVAIKVSRAEGDEPRILARLQHANIVPVHSAYDDPETGWRVLCMPYFGGANLAQVLDSAGSPSPGRSAGLSLIDALDRISRTHSIGHASDGELTSGPASGQGHVEAAPSPLSLALSSGVVGSALPVIGSGLVFGFRSLIGRIAGRGSIGSIGHPSLMPADDPHQPALQFFRGATAIQAAVWIVARLAEGLDHAHSRGLLHRDLKPANILLAADGTPMLLDFNLSADSRPQSSDGEAGRAMIGGTLPYMAPEHLGAFLPRATDSPIAIDERADIYAMGLILFEVLAGEHPLPLPPTHPGTSPIETIQRMIEDRRRPPSLRARCPDVPWSLDALVTKCLEFDPRRRYGRARDLAEDLRRFLDDRPMKHCPEPSPRERAAKFVRRHPGLTSATSIGLLALVLMVGVGAAALAALGGMRGLMARFQRQAFEREFVEAQFLLNTAGPSDRHLAAGLSKARGLFDRLVLDESQARPAADWYRRLTNAEQRRVLEQTVELILLESRVRVRLASRFGTASDRQEALRQAIARLDLAQRIGDHVPAALYGQRARFHKELGENDLAARDQRLASTASPSTCHDWTLLGTTLLADGNADAAEDALRRALRLDCTSFWAWFMLGHCHYAQGRFLESSGDFSACTVQGPQFAWVHFNRGLALARAGQLEAARDAYDFALRTDPTFAEALVNRALVNLELNRVDRALDDLSRAIEFGRDDVAVLAARGEALARLGRLEEAQAQFQALLANDPDNAVVRVARAMTRLRTDPSAARADLEHVLANDPRNPSARYGMALLVRADDPGKALRHLDAAIAADPHLVDAIQLRALIRARLGDPAALDDVARLVKVPTALRYYNAACAVTIYADKAHEPRQLAHAMELLIRAVDLGFPAAEAATDPDLAPLRDQPAFRRLSAGRRPVLQKAG